MTTNMPHPKFLILCLTVKRTTWMMEHYREILSREQLLSLPFQF
jgi:hypothetical protein